MKFAHIADSHLGAFSKNPKLRDLNFKAFKEAISRCIEENVDFIIIAGDLFHNPLPDMDIVKRTVEVLNKAKSYKIPIYVIYGSHDFSAGTTSLLDVLAEAGVFEKATKYEIKGNKIRLLPVEDKKTGVKIVGMPGLTASMEVRYFTEDAIDRNYLEKIEGGKIFVFHTTIAELKPDYISDKNAVPISKLPRGFDYYAGGHLHERIVSKIDTSPIIYPGALFGATYNDLDVLTGKEKGFYIVEDFKPRFIPIKVCEFEKKIYDATGKTARKVEEELMNFAAENHSDRVVILKVRGTLRSGKVADIDFRKIREKILETASEILLNTYSLSTEEKKKISVPAGNPEEIENRVFDEISVYGVDVTKRIFRVLKEEIKEDERKEDYRDRIWKAVYPILIQAVNREKKEKEVKKEVEEKKGRTEERKPQKKVSKRREIKNTSIFDFG